MSFLQDLLGPRQGFEGGLYLPDHKSQLARRPIEPFPADGPLHVPLQGARDLPTTPLAKPGDRVLGGQMLARAAAPDAICVSAPTSARVLSLGRAWTAADGEVDCITLEPDGLSESIMPEPRWESDLVLSELAEKGVMCPNPRRSAHALLADAAAAGVSQIIVNAMETEPFLAADLRCLVEMPGRLIEAACEFADALGVSRVIFALPYRHRRVVKRVEAEAAGRGIEIVPLSEKYPQCQPIVLTRTLLDIEVPAGSSPLACGVLVVPLALVRMIAEALLDGRAVTHAVMTVGGDCVERPGTYRVPVGTPLSRVAKRVGLSAAIGGMVCGGPLTGVQVSREDAVVTADMNGLLLFRNVESPRPIPCVRCGWCVEDCPVGLEPVSLMQLEHESIVWPVDRSRLRACVDCGLCSYVCPSELPLAASIRRTRQRLDRVEAAQG